MKKNKNVIMRLLILSIIFVLSMSFMAISYANEDATEEVDVTDVADNEERDEVMPIADGGTITDEKTLREAIKKGETVKLDGNIENLKNYIEIGNTVTLDLNGYTITKSSNEGDKKGIFYVTSAGNLIIIDTSAEKEGRIVVTDGDDESNAKCIQNEGTVTIEAGNYSAYTCVLVYGKSKTNISGGTFTATAFPVATNGNDTDKEKTIDITGGNFTGCLYFPADGTYNIEGDRFEANERESAIEIKRGRLTIKGGTFTASVESNSAETGTLSTSGTGPYVGAIVVSKPETGYDGEVTVDIQGGTFKNTTGDAIVMVNQTNNDADTSEIKITGEITVDGNIVDYSSNENSNANKGITIEGSGKVIEEGNVVAKNSNGEFTTLQQAIDWAENEDKVTLLRDVKLESEQGGYGIEIKNKNITLDLSGKKLTVDTNVSTAVIRVDSTSKLTVEDSSIEGTGAIGDPAADYSDPNTQYTNGINTSGTLIVNSGTINGYYAIFANGENDQSKSNVDGYTTTINDGTFNGGFSTYGSYTIKKFTVAGGIIKGITYFPGAGDYEIKGGTFTVDEIDDDNNAVLEIKRGKLTISGGTFECNADSTSNSDKYVGNGESGSLKGTIIVSKEDHYGDTTIVNISGGSFINNFKHGDVIAVVNQASNSDNNKSINVTINGNKTKITGSVKKYIREGTQSSTINISGGYYTEDPSEYVVEDYVVVGSDINNYLYMIEQRNTKVKVPVETYPGASSLDDDNSYGLTRDQFTAESNVLIAYAKSVANNSDIIPYSSEEVKDMLIKQEISVQDDVMIVVEPYIEIKEIHYDQTSNATLTFDVEALYNLIATTASNVEEMKLGSNAAIIKTGILEINNTPIELTFGLPKDFVTKDEELFVHHKKGDKTYIYETIKGDNNTITFTNRHGFSEFEVTKDGGVAENKTTDIRYRTLQAAIDDVKDDEQIVLLVSNNEFVTVSRNVSFVFSEGSNLFSGSIEAGSGYKRTMKQDEQTGSIRYTFTQSSGGSSSGGGSGVTKYKITVTVGPNGNVTPSGNVRVEKGKDQRFDITPNNGYVVEDVKVDGESVGAVTSYTFEDVTKAHTLSVTFKAGNGTTPTEPSTTNTRYTDVGRNAWFYNAIEYVSEKGLMQGTGANKFDPDISVTRGMMATVLYRLSGANTNGTSTFTDVPAGSYYSNAIAWAAEKGIVTGVGENRFDPERAIKREEMATMIARYISTMEVSIETSGEAGSAYADAGTISSFATEAVTTMKTTGLMEGKNGNNFDPAGLATRAEVATILMRFVEKTTTK